MLSRIRRSRSPSASDRVPSRPGRGDAAALSGPSWDYTSVPAQSTEELQAPSPSAPPLRAQLLAIFADPRVRTLSLEGAMRAVHAPRPDVELALDALVQSGMLARTEEGASRYWVPDSAKHELEAMFREAEYDLGETPTALVRTSDPALVGLDDDVDEPRLPVTAGLLSLFLPGTGQLLNGDVGRASLVFAVWSLAWITHLSPVWTFVCLYAGAEAFFTAKIRSMERKLTKDALSGKGPTPPPSLPPAKPSSSSA